jgi:hypothetical protein
MHRNQELLDFEIDLMTGKVEIIDAPRPDDAMLRALGLAGPDLAATVEGAIRERRLSARRNDLPEILEAFGARTSTELAFLGHGLSLADKLWYRAPGATERWEDVNFLDNEWDDAFYRSVLTRDCKILASCSPDVPDLTTKGRLRKAWERTGDGICLLKEPSFEDGSDLEGELLSADLCRLLFGKDAYQPLSIVERSGRRFSLSPLMIGRDEELVQGSRLFSMGGFDDREMLEIGGLVTPQLYIDVMARAGVADVSAQVARLFAFKALALLHDLHAGNYGVIFNFEANTRRAAPPFDYDHSFGFLSASIPLEIISENPNLAALCCARDFSNLDPSWDWGWYDPHALEGFESRILDLYSRNEALPPRFGEVVAWLFAMQREYVNKVQPRGVGRRGPKTHP